MLYEISRKDYFINKIDEPRLYWQNDNISVHIDKGIQVMVISHNIDCFTKEINFSSTTLPNTKNSPATDLLARNKLPRPLTNLEVSELVLDPGFWPYNPELTQDTANISHIEWSPQGAYDIVERIIAVLNSGGNVELFSCKKCQWISLLDLSSKIRSNYEKQDEVLRIKRFEELKKVVFAIESSAIAWGSKCDGNSCYFVTAQRNGMLLLWKIKIGHSNTKAFLKCETQTDIGEIITMKWIHTEENSFILLCANSLGQIFAYNYKVGANSIELVSAKCLWKYKDRMVTKYIQYDLCGDKIIVLYSKHRHLLVQLIDFNCAIIAEDINNINDYGITNIIKTIDGFYLSTVNCKVYKINVDDTNNKLKVNNSGIAMKDSYCNYELYSIATSPNNVLWILAMVNRNVMFKKHTFKLELIIMAKDNQESEISLLLNNPSRKFTNYWDCIELLRYKAVKLKDLPNLDYHSLYTESNTDIYKLKIYLIIVKLYNLLEKLLKNNYKGSLPETSENLIKEKILSLHAVQHIKDLHNNELKKGDLSNFEMQSFVATKKFLEYYFKKCNRNLSEVLPNKILSFKNVDVKYSCQSCDKVMVGFTCEDKHLNMICSLSFVPIESDDYLACYGCNSISSIELWSHKPLCLFCDLPMTTYDNINVFF